MSLLDLKLQIQNIETEHKYYH